MPALHHAHFPLARVAISVSILAALMAAPGLATAQSAGGYAKGRILVMPKAGLPDSALAEILKTQGAGKGRRLGKSDLHVVELPEGTEQQMVERLSRNPHIRFAELDALVSPDFVPDDPYFGSEWHLAKMGTVAAWDMAKGSGVTIAILDTGVDATHPDLASRMVPGWNFYDNTAITSDVHGHGTMVAGTAAATMSNGAGVAGIAGQARIMPIRITSTTGSATYSATASGLTFAADKGARVANISFSGMQRSSSVASAAQYFRSKGGVVTVAAGNSGTLVTDIPVTDAFLAVGGTDSADVKASWSSTGAYVDLAAPGVNIYTTARGGGYTATSGTSVAAPLTAGVAALMMSAKPGITGAQVESLLFSTALDLGAAGKDASYGHGRVNAQAAVAAALNITSPTADTQAPSVAFAAPVASSTVSGLASVSVNATDNVGVARVELRANGLLVASDTAAPFSFSWDTTKVASGMVALEAKAYDAANNAATALLSVNVANVVDSQAPTVKISNPAAGTSVSGTVSILVTADDNAGAATLSQRLYLNGQQVASTMGGKLSYGWNTRKAPAGTNTIRAEATDAAGNLSAVTVQVSKASTTSKGSGGQGRKGKGGD